MTPATTSQPKAVKGMEFVRIGIGIGLSALTAGMLILAFHPYNVWPLAFFALVPMLVAQYRVLPLKWSGMAQAVGIGGWLFVFLTQMAGIKEDAGLNCGVTVQSHLGTYDDIS